MTLYVMQNSTIELNLNDDKEGTKTHISPCSQNSSHQLQGAAISLVMAYASLHPANGIYSKTFH